MGNTKLFEESSKHINKCIEYQKKESTQGANINQILSRLERLLILLILSSLTLLPAGCSEDINPLTQPSVETRADETVDSDSVTNQNTKVTVADASTVSPITIIEPTDSTKLEETGGKILRTPSEDNQIRAVGIWNIEAHLKGDKIYRLNQFRDTAAIETYKELFGVDKDFEPIISMEAKGPGKIKITSKSIQDIEFELSTEKEKFEIFPNFKKEFLKSNTKNQTESLKILFVEGTKETVLEELELTWSNQHELYVLDDNLNDIITLIQPNIEEKSQAFENSIQWLRAATTGLNKFNIELEESDPINGYLKIKSSKEMKDTKRATIYDLCVWLTTKAIESGFEVEIIATPNYCVLALSELPTKKGILNTSNQYYIDTAPLIPKQKRIGEASTKEIFNIDKNVDLSIKKGEEHINKEFQENADKMFALKIKEWDNAYKILE